MSEVASPRLERLVRRPAPAAPEPERCDLCAEAVPERHRHLLDVESRELKCVCTPCRLLFEGPAVQQRLKLIPGARRRAAPLADEAWAALGIPVGMAFFFLDSREDRLVALYPGPAGATESLLGLDAWPAGHPPGGLEPDVEALLVNRARGARDDLIVGIDDCYRLVGLIRANWRGFTGGQEVWRRIGAFFDELRREAR